MRKRFELQYSLGTTPIEKIKIPKTRDELPPVLRALQYIYQTPEINTKIFEILESKIKLSQSGRPGMTLWEILVLGIVRLTLDANYDRLEHIANFDSLVRGILGVETNHGFTERKIYALQTIKDNVSLLDEATIDEISTIVVKSGHQLKKKEEKLEVKVDSYVLENNVHFPTDLNLLKDAINKSIRYSVKLSRKGNIEGWRKHEMWINLVKSGYRTVTKVIYGGGKNKDARQKRAVLDYIAVCEKVLQKIEKSKPQFEYLAKTDVIANLINNNLLEFEKKAWKQIDLVTRRLILNEKIPHEEKVFSLFEGYTEWINKGKAGNKIELGLKIAISTDQYGFILSKRVMEKEQDVEAAVPIFEILQKEYNLESISYDKGFWSKDNFEKIDGQIPYVIMPKKGKLNKEEYVREHGKVFKKKRKAHSAVESDINCLEHHGLNRCPDKGIIHFKTYVSLGVLSYNLHKLGNILQQEELKKRKKKKLAA
jgi:hypothetical protein